MLPRRDEIRWNPMADVISEYQRWKLKGEELRTKAKQAMEARFHDLLLEAITIADEYHADFGGTLKPPPAVTAFRYKAGAKRRRKPKVAAKSARVAPIPKPAPAKPDPQANRLRKRLVTARKKLDAAKAAGEPTKNLEDKVYEIEDDLRLATTAQ
jgi:hypothetical protein